MATLIGNSGHGRDMWETLMDKRLLTPWVWLDHHQDFTFDLHTTPVWIGINDPHLRAAASDDICYPDESWVHPTAHLGPGVEIGTGTHINYGAQMTRTYLGEHVTIGPGVTIGGDVQIGNRVMVGMGALIGVKHAGEHITIPRDCVIGAGAVLLHSIEEPGSVWVGNPARRIR